MREVRASTPPQEDQQEDQLTGLCHFCKSRQPETIRESRACGRADLGRGAHAFWMPSTRMANSEEFTNSGGCNTHAECAARHELRTVDNCVSRYWGGR